jgi:dolichol-phosphate mannosyltransferase
MQEKHRYMKGLIHWMGFAYLEVPFRPQERTVGTTKFSFLRLLALGKDCLFSFSKKPLTLATWAGNITLAIGLIWALAALVQFVSGTDPSNLIAQYLIVSSHLLAGATLVSVGILGEYVGRIWEQVRSRPNYLLKYDSQETRQRPMAHQAPHLRVFDKAASEPVRKDHESA